MSSPEVSIIVRTKNEERWIAHCLGMVFKQDFDSFELILVDNGSTDHTVEVAKRFPISTILSIEEFLPGRALNTGIRASKGKYIVCLSAHCVPKSTTWLSQLRQNFLDDGNIAGVYGRQLPLKYTEAIDKRDLLIVFGQEKRIQSKDYFFHNANSMLRKDIWSKFPFDEEVTNVEDRVWGKQVIEAGYSIAYDPDAAVFHHHGLHHGNSSKRASSVVSIIEYTDSESANDLPESLLPECANIAAVVPVRQDIQENTAEFHLLSKTIRDLKQAKYIDSVYLVTSDLNVAQQFSDSVIIVNREDIPNADSIGLDVLMKEILAWIEGSQNFPEALLYVNFDYALRPPGLFDELVVDAQYKGYDTVFPALVDYYHYWISDDLGGYRQIDQSMKPRKYRNPVYRALYGLGCLTASSILRKGNMIGGKIGIVKINDVQNAQRLSTLAAIEIEKPTFTMDESEIGIV